MFFNKHLTVCKVNIQKVWWWKTKVSGRIKGGEQEGLKGSQGQLGTMFRVTLPSGVRKDTVVDVVSKDQEGKGTIQDWERKCAGWGGWGQEKSSKYSRVKLTQYLEVWFLRLSRGESWYVFVFRFLGKDFSFLSFFSSFFFFLPFLPSFLTYFFSFFSAPVSWGSSLARDWTRATAMTLEKPVATLDP